MLSIGKGDVWKDLVWRKRNGVRRTLFSDVVGTSSDGVSVTSTNTEERFVASISGVACGNHPSSQKLQRSGKRSGSVRQSSNQWWRNKARDMEGPCAKRKFS